MFKDLLQTDFFQDVSTKAKNGIIKEDRSKYNTIFTEIKKILANDDKIIISDTALLIDKNCKNNL
jgi:hypothetical protein